MSKEFQGVEVSSAKSCSRSILGTSEEQLGPCGWDIVSKGEHGK